jgi:hypothetical protein
MRLSSEMWLSCMKERIMKLQKCGGACGMGGVVLLAGLLITFQAKGDASFAGLANMSLTAPSGVGVGLPATTVLPWTVNVDGNASGMVNPQLGGTSGELQVWGLSSYNGSVYAGGGIEESFVILNSTGQKLTGLQVNYSYNVILDTAIYPQPNAYDASSVNFTISEDVNGAFVANLVNIPLTGTYGFTTVSNSGYPNNVTASFVLPTLNADDTMTVALDEFLSGSAVSVLPEPSTYLAGAMLLIPFGMSCVRKLRARL